MPSTRVERILAGLGLAVGAALAGLAIPAWLDYRSAEPPKLAPASAAALAQPTVSAPPTRAATTATVAKAPVTTSVPRVEADVRLVAARGDCWLEVRLGSAGGATLFRGILEQGASRRFAARALWMEMGAPGALDVTVNGDPVEGLPQTPTTVVASTGGVRPA